MSNKNDEEKEMRAGSDMEIESDPSERSAEEEASKQAESILQGIIEETEATKTAEMVTIPADELESLRKLASIVSSNQLLSIAASATQSEQAKQKKKFSLKNIKIEKFAPEKNKQLVDHGITRWLQQFNREIDFELRIQDADIDDETRKMTLYRFMSGKAATFVRQMATSFDSMSYDEVQHKLKEKYKKTVSADKRLRMISNCKRKEGEDFDEYLTRMITIADSMPEGRTPYEPAIIASLIRHADPRHTGQLRVEHARVEQQDFDSQCETLLRTLSALTEDENHKRSERESSTKRKSDASAYAAYQTPADARYKDAICEYTLEGKKCGTKGHTTSYHQKFFPQQTQVSQADIVQRRARIIANKKAKIDGKDARAAAAMGPKEEVSPSSDEESTSEPEQEIPSDGQSVSELSTDSDDDSDSSSGKCYAAFDGDSDEPDGTTPHTEWILDSGSSFHMSGQRELFRNLRKGPKRKVKMADYETNKTQYRITNQIGEVDLLVRLEMPHGRYKWSKQTLKNVAFVPGLTVNLISVSEFRHQRCMTIAQGHKMSVYSRKSKEMITGYVNGGIYLVTTIALVDAITHGAAYFAGKDLDTEENWHQRLGHLNYAHIRKTIKLNTADGIRISKKRERDEENCEVCQVGKIRRTNIPKKSTRSQEDKDKVGSVDCVGPLTPQSNKNNRYIFFHTYRDYVEIEFGNRKDLAKRHLKHWIERIDREHGPRAIQVVRSDNGGEYQNTEITEYLKNKGIKSEFTEARTPHQNGLAERKHQVVMDMIRTMIEDSDVPDNLWEYAASYAVYILNRVYSRARPDGKSAYEKRYQKTPNLRHLRKFGERCVYRVQIRKKLCRKGKRGRFIGFDPQRKGYKIYDPKRKKVINTKDVVFTNTQPETTSADTLNEEEAHDDSPNVAPRRSERLRNKHITAAFVALAEILKEPVTVTEALQGPHKQDWTKALWAEINALNANNTWKRVRRPKGANVIKCKWVLKIKFDSEGRLDKFKARLVAKGFKQQYLVDYYETYAPVASKDSFRIFLAVAAKRKLRIKQYDVPSAYVKATLDEEIHIELPEAFRGRAGDLGRATADTPSTDEQPNDVLKLEKGLYGLKQAGRAWHKEISQKLMRLGLKPLASDPCLFVSFKTSGEILMLLLYVDDILIAGDWTEKAEEVVQGLTEAYQIKDLGEARHFLGMTIQRRGDGFLLSQEHFARELIRRFELEKVAPRSTPLDAKEMFIKEEGAKPATDKPYRQIVGALNYLSTCSRPDITFAVNQASKFCNEPTEKHWDQLMKICGYVLHTANYGLWFKGSETDMEVFSDADWANDPDTRKSISGVLVKAWGSTVMWMSKRQTIVASSTKAAETIAACSALSKGEKCKETLEEFKMKNNTGVQLNIDNEPAIKAIKNEKPADGNKHLSIRYHIIKEKVMEGEVDVIYCESKNQLADIFTKSLNRQQFERLRKQIKVVPAKEQSE